MTYQYRREPLTQHEATILANACATPAERLVIWTMLDTGLRVSELTGLTRQNVDWQQHRIVIYGKGGPFGHRSKRRVVPMSAQARSLLEPHFSMHDSFGMGAARRSAWSSESPTGQRSAGLSPRTY
jgi:integrase/recombinase XerD